MWVFGGQKFDGTGTDGQPMFGLTDELWSFDFITNSWQSYNAVNRPSARRGATAVEFAGLMYTTLLLQLLIIFSL